MNQFPRWPVFADDEIQAATEILQNAKTNYWTGEQGKLFETEFAKYCGVDYGIALANGSLALELALYALDISEGDEVIVTPRSFIASASCVVLRGATPVFVDVDLESQNITAENILAAITDKTKAIICVHLAGWPCDMHTINKVAKEHNLFVIEDCAQAHGAEYYGQKVGSLGDIGCFSFCQDKIMSTAGEGGMLVTNSKTIWEKAWCYKDHGKDFESAHQKHEVPLFRYIHHSIGSNWRLTELQSTIGRLQLKKLNQWISIRNDNANFFIEQLEDAPLIRIPRPSSEITHAYYKFYLFIKPEFLKEGWSRNRIVADINSQGIPCFTGTCPEIYLEKAFADSEHPRLHNAKILGETSLMLLVHPTLSKNHILKMVEGVKSVLNEANL